MIEALPLSQRNTFAVWRLGRTWQTSVEAPMWRIGII
jgi:hypothetical protein